MIKLTDILERIGFSGPDYNDEVGKALSDINELIQTKSLSSNDPMVQEIANKLDDVANMVSNLPEKERRKIGFREGAKSLAKKWVKNNASKANPFN
jgi:hypothetical protein